MKKLKKFYALWASQSLSQLGSSVTSFALTLWLYETSGSSLSTALLAICTYAPYVLMSIFAGALIDRFDKKKTMLVCDLLAALSSIIVFLFYRNNILLPWHLYVVNIVSGLMNTIQQPSSEVALTLVIDKEDYQKTSALKNLSRSIISILNPLIASALYGIKGLDLVIAFDLGSFFIAFTILLFFIKLPKVERENHDSFLIMVSEGLTFLKKTPLIFDIILFMSGVNFAASAFDAILPGLVIPFTNSETLGLVSSWAGIAMIVGSVVVARFPAPKNRVRVIYYTMVFSFMSENFILALSRNPILWCVGQFLGWAVVPIMSTNLEVILRKEVPVQLQGRVYACRNTFQYFTILIGLLVGGWLVDKVGEPLMVKLSDKKLFTTLFGLGKGSGAALIMFVLGVFGCLLVYFSGRKLMKYHYDDNK